MFWYKGQVYDEAMITVKLVRPLISLLLASFCALRIRADAERNHVRRKHQAPKRAGQVENRFSATGCDILHRLNGLKASVCCCVG